MIKLKLQNRTGENLFLAGPQRITGTLMEHFLIGGRK
jgi:hypothetical protein